MQKDYTKIDEEFVEKGADLEHNRWARWQEYMFSKFVEHENGKGEYFCLPRELWERWSRQIDTPYLELSESEKESDRKETRNYLPLLHKAISLSEQSLLERVEELSIELETIDVRDILKALKHLPQEEVKNK
jgi:hypothetical protein